MTCLEAPLRIGALSTGSYLLARAELARQTGLSIRRLERLFRKDLGWTPTRHYLEFRLGRARRLLGQTSMSVLDVGLARRIVSASHSSKCYSEYIDKILREDRHKIN